MVPVIAITRILASVPITKSAVFTLLCCLVIVILELFVSYRLLIEVCAAVSRKSLQAISVPRRLFLDRLWSIKRQYHQIYPDSVTREGTSCRSYCRVFECSSVTMTTATIQQGKLLDVLKKKMRQTKEEMEKYKDECEEFHKRLQLEIMRREDVRSLQT